MVMGGKWEVMFAFSSLVGWLYDERWTDGSLCTEQRAGQLVPYCDIDSDVSNLPPPPKKKTIRLGYGFFSFGH